METVSRGTPFFINTDLGHHLPVIQLVPFLKNILVLEKLCRTKSASHPTVLTDSTQLFSDCAGQSC